MRIHINHYLWNNGFSLGFTVGSSFIDKVDVWFFGCQMEPFLISMDIIIYWIKNFSVLLEEEILSLVGIEWINEIMNFIFSILSLSIRLNLKEVLWGVIVPLFGNWCVDLEVFAANDDLRIAPQLFNGTDFIAILKLFRSFSFLPLFHFFSLWKSTTSVAEDVVSLSQCQILKIVFSDTSCFSASCFILLCFNFATDDFSSNLCREIFFRM